MMIKLLKKSKFAELKPNEYSHYDNQTLKTRASHLTKFTMLRTNEYSH